MISIKKIFAKPSAASLAQNEKEEAERQLLRHQSENEYHANMVRYYEQVVLRLSEYSK